MTHGLRMKTKIKRLLTEIEASAEEDDERAHELEDELWEAVLLYISESGFSKNCELARLALTSREISFCRWHA